MGMQIFEKSGTFNPADWGLGAGDMVQVVCVGGGCSGDGASDWSIVKGVEGTNSKFGEYADSSLGRIIGKGGQGFTNYSSSDSVAYAGGGAGGYLPGVTVIGGNGGGVNIPLPSGLGGANSAFTEINNVAFLPYSNYYDDGNCGAGRGEAIVAGSGQGYASAGGNGYGAGGGGVAYLGSRDTQTVGGSGGNSGKFLISTIKLSSTSPVEVVVGTGGTSVGTNGAGSEISGKGADGVVVVTW